MRTALPAFVALWLVGASTAFAQDPCAEDVRRLCPDVRLGSGRGARCLREHEPELSVACRERLQADALKARRLVEEFGRACQADVAQYCPAIEPGGGRLLGCLAQHQLDLSSACQAEMDRIAKARERVDAFRKACRADVERLCKGVAPEAGALVACLEANQASLSSECSVADVARAVEAASVVDVIEEMTRQERVREILEILQGIDSVAFSRSQILLQFDSYDHLAGKANGSRFLFNPQFVFGRQAEFALQVKVPVMTLYPPTAATQSGLGDLYTSFGWNFHRGQVLGLGVRQYLSLGLQWQTAANPSLGTAWAVVPAYGIALGLARWVSLTTQVVWFRSPGSTGGYSELDLLVLEPIMVFNLPGRSFLALDTKLGWDLRSDTFVPLMKGVGGMFVDRQKSLSITAWYQGSLSTAAVPQSYRFGVGLGLAYYFDW